MEYPEEIYATRNGGTLASKDMQVNGSSWGRRLAFDVGYDVGYVAGRNEQSDYIESMSSLESVLTDVEQLEGEDLPFVKRLIERTVRAVRAEQADSLEGYSNLTAAISAGEPIDYEKLDGLNVMCVNPELRGEVHGTLKRNAEANAELSGAWRSRDMDEVYNAALWAGWRGKRGWSLYVEGDIPMRRKTADELELYTYFLGQVKGDSPYLAYVGSPLATDTKSTIFYAPEMLKSINPSADWEVIEEYGPFQKPDTK